MTGLYVTEIAWGKHPINIVGFERSIILVHKKDDSIYGPALDCIYDKASSKKFAFIKKYNKPEYKLSVRRDKDYFGRYYRLVEAEYNKEHLFLGGKSENET